MQADKQYQENLNAITHSPYYGCTVRVVSKARFTYEGVLDGISTNKDRIYLKNVRVKSSTTTSSNRNSYTSDLDQNSPSDTLNAVMIDHLTNDIHTYEEVCLNVRDIQELKLIQLPSTFHESKAKLRAIDPCLLDIRLSSSDDYETKSNNLNSECHLSKAPIGRQNRGESFGSNGESQLITSSSNDSSSSFSVPSPEKFADESNDESIDEQIEKFSKLATSPMTVLTENYGRKPVTLLAKKVLPRKSDRRTDILSNSSMNTNQNSIRQTISDNHEIIDRSTRVNNNNTNTLKKTNAIHDDRRVSPIRVTITSKLNPNATPFYTQQRHKSTVQNPTLTFYERSPFRPRLQPVVSPDRAQSFSYGINNMDKNQPQQEQQQHYQHGHQRYIPPRHMAARKNFVPVNNNGTTITKTRSNRSPPPTAKYRIVPSASLEKRIFPYQTYRHDTRNNPQLTGLVRQISVPTSNQSMLTLPIQENPSISRNHVTRRSTASVHSTMSLPYQYGNYTDRNKNVTSLSFRESIDARRVQRTFSAASSCSSVSLDIGPHSIPSFDSPVNLLPSCEEQYDFEKANEEFRRYLELEQLVIRRSSLNCSNLTGPDDNSTKQHHQNQPQQQQQQQQPLANSYKKEISFFDRISCTATTGTAVGYTEIDETEKNLETFGNDALLMVSNLNDTEW